MDQQRAYRVVPQNESFVVTDSEDRHVLSCRDERSAQHYAVLLSEAYRRGYRHGRRDARSNAEDGR